jgi:hypothetical protein
LILDTIEEYRGKAAELNYNSDYFDIISVNIDAFSYWRSKLNNNEKLITLPKNNKDTLYCSIVDGELSATNHDDLKPEIRYRAEIYCSFIKQVLSFFPIDITIDFCFFLDDIYDQEVEFPLFHYQRVKGEKLFLLPDWDSLTYFFYEDYNTVDKVSYLAKKDQCIFVGSTTGVDPHTGNSILNTNTSIFRNQRINSAVYFKNHESVHIVLPKIIQYDCAETAEAIKQMIGDSEYIDMASQYEYKFILSMDGNGATCSRVALTLRSNSVLIKRESDRELSWFNFLRAGHDYISIRDDSDLNYLIRNTSEYEEFFLGISLNGKQFFNKHLTRFTMMRQVAFTLLEYMRIYSNDLNKYNTVKKKLLLFSPKLLLCLHCKGKGDIVCRDGDICGDADHDIEGISIASCLSKLDTKQISYLIKDSNGIFSEWICGSYFAGSRGKGIALQAIAVDIITEQKKDTIVLEVWFSDGAYVVVKGGNLACSSGSATIRMIRLNYETIS